LFCCVLSCAPARAETNPETQIMNLQINTLADTGAQESPKRLSARTRVKLRSMYADLREKQTALWSEIEGLEDGIAHRTDLMLVIEGTRQVVGDTLMAAGDTGWCG